MSFIRSLLPKKQEEKVPLRPLPPTEASPLNRDAKVGAGDNTNASSAPEFNSTCALDADATLKENAAVMPVYVKEQSKRLAVLVKRGAVSYRVLAYLAGVVMILLSFVNLVISLVNLAPAECLISVYGVIFGIVICMLEGREWACPAKWEKGIFFYARFLEFTWGRALLYLFAGSLQFSQPTHLNMISGGFVMGVGIISVITSYLSTKKLSKLRASIYSERELKRLFKENDSNRDGFLSADEFANLSGCLGLTLTRNELIAVFSLIDKNDDEHIDIDEFRVWWLEWGRHNLDDSFLI